MGKNMIVLAMSTLNFAPKLNHYYYDDEPENDITGVSQLEPITKYIISKLGRIGERIDEVIILSTAQTKEDKKKFVYTDENGCKCEENVTANEFYKERIKTWAAHEFKELYGENQINFNDDITVDENEPTKGISTLVELVSKYYIAENENKSHLYIDTQGGFRDVVFTMTSVIHALKIRDIVPDGIYSIPFNPNRDKKPSVILERGKSYSISDFVSGMDEFINYGRCKQLMKYYGLDVNDNNNDVQAQISCLAEEDSVKNVLDEIMYISEAISLCDIDRLSEHIVSILKKLQDYEKANDIFDIFVGDIKNEYSGLLAEGKIDLVKLVQWCMKKEFYQQALTIIESKFPKIFFEKRWYYFDERNREEIEQRKKPKFKDVENYFFDSYRKEEEKNISLSDLTEQKQAKFECLVEIHRKLKEQRNYSNHAIQNNRRFSVEDLRNNVNEYVRLYNEINSVEL